MKYIELSTNKSFIIFSKESVQSMKLKEGSGLLVFKIKGQRAFGFQERKRPDFEKMKLAFLQKPTKFSNRLIALSDQPTPTFMLWMLNINEPSARLELKEKVNAEGQIIYYIGRWTD